MDLDTAIQTWAGALLWPALLGSLAAFISLTLLARAHVRAKLIVDLAQVCRRRREEQERIRDLWGYGPRLQEARALERAAHRLLKREGL